VRSAAISVAPIHHFRSSKDLAIMSSGHSITVTREPGFLLDRTRPYRLFVDDKCALEILEGEQKQIVVQPGVHKLSLKIDWCRSQSLTLDARDGLSTSLWCWPKARPYTWPIFLTVGRARYIAMSSQPRGRSAPQKTWFRIYQVMLLAAVLAFIGYEISRGKIAAYGLLVLVAVFAIIMRLLATKGTPPKHTESGGDGP
jgi:hypothetical protein